MVNDKLRDSLRTILYKDAQWYTQMSGWQNDHGSDLSMTEIELEKNDEGPTMDAIHDAVLESLTKEEKIGLLEEWGLITKDCKLCPNYAHADPCIQDLMREVINKG